MASIYRCEDIVIDLERARVQVGGQEATLTTKEVSLLGYLAQRAGEVVSRDQLLQDVWGFGRPVPTRAVDNVVRRVRQKLGEDPSCPRMLFTVYGEGYRLRVEPVPNEPTLQSAEGSGLTIEPPADAAPNRFATELRGFIGREAELAHLREQARRGRPVQIVGPGGAGKTSLARVFTERQEQAACFCDLTTARSEADVVNAIGQALGGFIDEDGGPAERWRALMRMAQAVGPGWLVLDNAEHVIEAVTTAVDLLVTRVDLRLLVTSRVQLSTPHLWTLQLGALGVADAEALLRARMGTAAKGWTAAQLTRLVSLLDGQPLALELAAARSTLLGPEALLRRAKASLDVLSGSTGAVARHAALEASIQVSWELLSPSQREDLAALTAFEGSFSLNLAERVLPPGRGAPLERLDRLVRASLVQRTQGDRLRLAWTVALFARRHGHGLAAAQRRQGRCMAELARDALGRLHGPDGGDTLARLDAESPNLRRAAVEAELPEERVLVMLALDGWLRRRGASRSRARWLGRALDEPISDRQLHALRLVAWCELQTLLARDEEARAAAEEVLSLEEAGGDLRSDALRLLAVSDARGGDAARALRRIEAAEAEAEGVERRLQATQERVELGALSEAEIVTFDRDLREHQVFGILVRLCIARGMSARYAGRPVRAERRYREALHLSERLGWGVHEAGVCSLLGDLEMGLGRYDEAERHLLRACMGGARFGLASILAAAWANLGAVALVRGDRSTARELLGRAVDLVSELEPSPQVALMVVLHAVGCAASGAPREAREELDRGAALIADAGAAPDARLRHAEACLSLARALLDAFERGPEHARRALADWEARDDLAEFAADGDSRVLVDLLRQCAAVRAQ